MKGWHLAVVRRVDDGLAEIGLDSGADGTIPLDELRWARPRLKNDRRGPPVKRVSQVLTAGDVVAVAPVREDKKGELYPANTFALRQIPDIDGSIVALDPHTGRVMAMTGGYSYEKSQFNRAVQAKRQPGSAFKPIVYLAALESGYSPSTLILDAPFVIDQGPGLPKWRPANHTPKILWPKHDASWRRKVEKPDDGASRTNHRYE